MRSGKKGTRPNLAGDKHHMSTSFELSSVEVIIEGDLAIDHAQVLTVGCMLIVLPQHSRAVVPLASKGWDPGAPEISGYDR